MRHANFRLFRVGLLAGLLAAGCASVQNTPAQDLAWERWQKCSHFRTITLKEIRQNGEIWVWTHYGPDLAAWQQCEREAQLEQRGAGRLAPGTQPRMAASDVRGLVKFAYFTDTPPAPGTFLHTTFNRNMPPEVKEFPAGRPVTFFYAVTQLGRVLSVLGRWIGPDGTVVKTEGQIINQMGSQASWTWQTQTLHSAEVMPGTWTVELLIDGNSVGRYSFTVVGRRTSFLPRTSLPIDVPPGFVALGKASLSQRGRWSESPVIA